MVANTAIIKIYCSNRWFCFKINLITITITRIQ